MSWIVENRGNWEGKEESEKKRGRKSYLNQIQAEAIK